MDKGRWSEVFASEEPSDEDGFEFLASNEQDSDSDPFLMDATSTTDDAWESEAEEDDWLDETNESDESADDENSASDSKTIQFVGAFAFIPNGMFDSNGPGSQASVPAQLLYELALAKALAAAAPSPWEHAMAEHLN